MHFSAILKYYCANTIIIIKIYSICAHLLSLVLLTLRFYFYGLSGISICFGEVLYEWEILNFNRLRISLVFILDYISLFFLRLVSLIAGSVIIFSTSYMRSEFYFRRFIIIVGLFVISIYLLILSPNIIRILLGWDGLGVTSYLLVVFYQSNKSYNAGIITAITNRLGDCGLLICIGLLIFYGNYSFRTFNIITNKYLRVFIIILVVSASTKRAQVPFSAWLPAAIAAPTPVSALVHSSTLVTAGVFLLIRFNFLLINRYFSYTLIMVGIFTIILAGAAAINEIDIKKIIALSTLSQLGVIMITLGFQEPVLSFFHLLSHAYFKAILFICAGIIIHNIKDYQDIRKIRSISKNIPLTFRVLTVANLSLCGLPFLRGFYSKDLILECIIISDAGLFNYVLIIIGTLLTVLYSLRMSILLRISSSTKDTLILSLDKDKFIHLGIWFLIPFSLLGGINLIWRIFSSPSHIFLPYWMKMSILGIIILSSILYVSSTSNTAGKSTPLKNFLGSIWFFPWVFSSTASLNFFTFSKNRIKLRERSWLENILYVNIILTWKKLNNYSDVFSNNITLRSILIVILLLIFI